MSHLVNQNVANANIYIGSIGFVFGRTSFYSVLDCVDQHWKRKKQKHLERKKGWLGSLSPLSTCRLPLLTSLGNQRRHVKTCRLNVDPADSRKACDPCQNRSKSKTWGKRLRVCVDFDALDFWEIRRVPNKYADASHQESGPASARLPRAHAKTSICFL